MEKNPHTVTDNTARHRYELELDGDVAILEYEEQPGCRILTHTIVPPRFEGQGIGRELVEAALQDIRDRGCASGRCAASSSATSSGIPNGQRWSIRAGSPAGRLATSSIPSLPTCSRPIRPVTPDPLPSGFTFSGEKRNFFI